MEESLKEEAQMAEAAEAFKFIQVLGGTVSQSSQRDPGNAGWIGETVLHDLGETFTGYPEVEDWFIDLGAATSYTVFLWAVCLLASFEVQKSQVLVTNFFPP